jgi:hypothetical protein
VIDGIHRKYEVKRTDGSSAPGGKHADCAYFVLDLEHDEFAVAALKAYAKACKATYPDLAADLRRIISNTKSWCSCREAFCPHRSAWGPEGPSGMAHALMSGDKQ